MHITVLESVYIASIFAICKSLYNSVDKNLTIFITITQDKSAMATIKVCMLSMSPNTCLWYDISNACSDWPKPTSSITMVWSEMEGDFSQFGDPLHNNYISKFDLLSCVPEQQWHSNSKTVMVLKCFPVSKGMGNK